MGSQRQEEYISYDTVCMYKTVDERHSVAFIAADNDELPFANVVRR